MSPESRMRRDAYMKEWRAKNREKVLAYAKVYNASYYATNKEDQKEDRKAHYEVNKQMYRDAGKKWKASKPGYGAASAMRHYVAKRKAVPLWADNKKILEIYAEANFKGWHVDHIVPLISKLVCGLHCEANLEPKPGLENQAKSNLWWPDMW